MPRVSAVILAGGQSRRLGMDKAFAQVGGVPIIERVVRRVCQISDDTLIVTSRPESYRHLGVRLVEDIWPGKGSLGGIYSGLGAARHEQSLVVACDMPFLDPKLLRFMVLLSEDFDVVIPNPDGLLEPLHAVYSRTCLKHIESLLHAGDLRIVDFLSQVQVRYIERAEVDIFDPHHYSLFNVNTPEDLERAQCLARELG